MVLKIKVFGERNTGTRAVIKMIGAAKGIANVGISDQGLSRISGHRQLTGQLDEIVEGAWKKVYREAICDAEDALLDPVSIWKHAAPVYDTQFRADDVRVIFIIRNPYSWALSLYRNPYHDMGLKRDLSFEEFLVFPWLSLARDRVPKLLLSPLELWNFKARAYVEFAKAAKADRAQVTWLRFEDFVGNSVDALAASIAQLGIERIKLVPLADATKRNGLYSDERVRYYGEERWRSSLSSLAIGLINDVIDWDIARHHRYARLGPEDFQ